MLILNHKLLESPLEICSFWLRDHCRCADCYLKDTFQRKFNISDIPLDVEAKHLKIADDLLHVTCE